MPTYLSPGVYPREVNYSAYVKSKGTSTWGIVGVFEKGPVGVPTLVGSLDEAQRIFGSFLTVGTTNYALYALKNFFENGGARAYVVRTAHYAAGAPTALAASANLLDTQGTPQVALEVTATSAGTWANTLKLVVTVSPTVTNAFDLKVTDAAGTVLETFATLFVGTDKVTDPNHAHTRINGRSQYITVVDKTTAAASATTRPAETTTTLGNTTPGNDGLAGITTEDFLGASTPGIGLRALDTVDVNFVSIPGEGNVAAAAEALGKGLLAYCAKRRDCIAILDGPKGLDGAGLAAFRTSPSGAAAFDDTYGALYGPWLQSTHPVTGLAMLLPPSGFVAGVYARNDVEGAVFTAPAGPNRAVLRGATDTEKPMSPVQRDAAYAAGVNPLATVAGALQVGGQKTLTLQPSALDRVNVRRLMCYVESSVQDAAAFLVFEANTKETWEAFKRTVSPLLRSLKDAGGLYDFVVICDKTLNTDDVIDTNTMKARVLVKPTKTAEFLPIDFAIAPTGANLAVL